VNEALKTVIRAFQADVQRGLALFRQHTGSDDLLSWRSRRLPLSGHLDAEHQHHYSFHGIGVRLRLAPDLHIDWDFGSDGRMDGFDHWRLQQFIEERPELQLVLPLSSLRSVFDAAERDGSIAKYDNLYCIAGEEPTGNA